MPTLKTRNWLLFFCILLICRCRLARVTTLVKKKEELNCHTNSEQQPLDTEDASDTDVDAQELEEFLDWRSKKAWK